MIEQVLSSKDWIFHHRRSFMVTRDLWPFVTSQHKTFHTFTFYKKQDQREEYFSWQYFMHRLFIFLLCKSSLRNSLLRFLKN